ncbi:hypothetical protein ACFL2D_01495 [Patescibacteria group bacterium]
MKNGWIYSIINLLNLADYYDNVGKRVSKKPKKVAEQEYSPVPKKPPRRALKVILIILGVVILAVAIAAGVYASKWYLQREEAITVDEVELKMYKSKSARDTDKTEQYEFEKIDPIQAIFTFTDASDETLIIYKLEKDGDVIQEVEIPLEGDDGERFVTAPTDLETGEYNVSIRQAGYVIKMISFTVN